MLIVYFNDDKDIQDWPEATHSFLEKCRCSIHLDVPRCPYAVDSLAAIGRFRKEGDGFEAEASQGEREGVCETGVRRQGNG